MSFYSLSVDLDFMAEYHKKKVHYTKNHESEKMDTFTSLYSTSNLQNNNIIILISKQTLTRTS